MTPRERLLAVLNGKMPDHVPCSPDISNMIPCRLTGKPFWDIYLYQDPPLWKAYIDAARYFGFDAIVCDWPWAVKFRLDGEAPPPKEVIVQRSDDCIVTQFCEEKPDGPQWSERVMVYRRGDPPAAVAPAKLGLPPVPTRFEEITGAREWPRGEALLRAILDYLGDDGILVLNAGHLGVITNEQQTYEYFDAPDQSRARAARMREDALERARRIVRLSVKPDLVNCGCSGCMVFQPAPTFRELALPIIRDVTAFFKKAGIPTMSHCCGPERAYVEMAARETDLTMIEPLETRPMGDCDLREIKQAFGDRLVLKGNLNTTHPMLRGTAEEVREAARKAIDDAGAGGRFILSTGDQCGRDTPDENIRAMVDVAKSYGRY